MSEIIDPRKLLLTEYEQEEGLMGLYDLNGTLARAMAKHPDVDRLNSLIAGGKEVETGVFYKD